MSSIGLYQVQNLIRQRVQFLCVGLDLDRVPKSRLNELDLNSVPIEKVEPIHDEQALNDHLMQIVSRRSCPPWWPIVLLCSDGLISSKQAQNLEAKGFTNVYFLKGGILGES